MIETSPLRLVTAASTQPLTLDEAKLWLRVDGTAENDLITDQIKGATQFVEDEISGHRQLITATYEIGVQSWWSYDFLSLPRPPLQAVDWIKYYDTNGTLTTLDSSYYDVKTYLKQPGTIALAYQKFWPVVQTRRNWPILIQFQCGYGSASSVPAKVKQVLRLVLNWMYSRRDPTEDEMKAVRNLLSSEGWGFYG